MATTEQFLSDFCRDLIAHPGERLEIIKGYTSLLQLRENAARWDEIETIHQWLQKPKNYDQMDTLAKTQWIVMTMGKIGSWLDARKATLDGHI